jgi:TonB-linked SusC/RagA family outer membrane protein
MYLKNDKMRNSMIKRIWLLLFMAIFSAFSISAQQRTITGKITDSSDGSPLVGANITIQGTTTGTVADVDGNFSIQAGPGDVLVFSYVGYTSQEIQVSDQTVINISLELAYEALDELVVVGYGYTKKSDLTGAIVSLNSEDLAVRPVTRIDYALQGQAAGVQVTNTSGMPGSSASIRIRGHGSLQTTNSPLWVIDGFIGGDINSVAPEDIESIEILKDASSTAIYGARGGNGVILVTTKRGEKNQNRIDFSYYHSISNVSKEMDLLDRAGYCTLRNRALTTVGLPAQFTQGQIDGSEPINGYIADTDWQNEIFRTAHTNYYNLSVSGGSGKTSYALSANYREEDGIIYNSDFKRGGVRLNLDHEISPKMRVGVSTNVYRTEGNSFNVTTGWSLGAAGGAITSFPYYPLYDSTGEYYNLATWDNPRLQAEGQKDRNKITGLVGDVFFSYEVIKGLTLKADIAGDYTSNEHDTFVTAELFGATATRGLARASIGDYYRNRWIGNVTATYDKTIAANHQLKVMLGVEQQVVNSDNNYMFSEEIGRESFLWYNMAAFTQANHTITSGTSGSVFQSLFGRIDYNFLNRYIVEATVRRDGSSKFGPKQKWGTFPSASAAWKMSEEDFIKNLNVFDQLKLRVSWGVSGNDNIALYQWLPRMAVGTNRSNANFGNVGGSGGDISYIGSSIGSIPNESVHWEESTITDIGLDMGFLNNRLRFNFDAYDRTTSELLWNMPLPLHTGYGDGWNMGTVNIISNIAEMNNRGLELAVGADIFARGDFRWTVNGNISINKNEVVSLANDIEFYTGITKIEPGKPIGNIWGFITDGIFQADDDVANTPRFTGDEGVGDQRFLDANHNGILTNADMGVIGNALPDYIFGIINTLSYKGFTLHAIINGVQGVDMYNGSRQTLSNGTLGEFNGGAWLKDSWTPENTNTDIPKMSDSYVDKTSDRFVEDASFIRLSNVQLSYSLPVKWLSSISLKHLTVYTSLQNYLTITKYTGYDPEMHSGGNSNLNLGYDGQNYPSTRSITFGVRVGI